MDYIKIITELGFVFEMSETIIHPDSHYDDTKVEHYINEETKHIISLFINDGFGCINYHKNERTEITTFNEVIKFYFKNIDRKQPKNVRKVVVYFKELCDDLEDKYWLTNHTIYLTPYESNKDLIRKIEERCKPKNSNRKSSYTYEEIKI